LHKFQKKVVSLYGSARLGEYSIPKRKENGEISDIDEIGGSENPNKNKAAAASSPFGGQRGLARLRGYTHYELTNHLGNVLAVVTDRKLISTNAFYVADVLTLTDYYAFGMQIVERTYNAPAYRYSMNGQEKDYDIDAGGNHTTALYWEYDSRIARRWNTDPIVKEWEAPYMCFGDNPITGSDVLGNTTEGDYYGADGTYLGNDGINDDKAYLVTNSIGLAKGKLSTINKGPLSHFSPLESSKFQYDVIELNVRNSDLLYVAATSYGEANSAQRIHQEMWAISNTIKNNMAERGDDDATSVCNQIAYATDGTNESFNNFRAASANDRNGTFMQSAVYGALNAFVGTTDYSNGATHWAGEDVGSTTEKRATGGLLFTNPQHDIMGIGSLMSSGSPHIEYIINKKGGIIRERGRWSYTWESTAAYSTSVNGVVHGTTFMRKSNDFLTATLARRY
jgi:hypothetical protein